MGKLSGRVVVVSGVVVVGVGADVMHVCDVDGFLVPKITIKSKLAVI